MDKYWGSKSRFWGPILGIWGLFPHYWGTPWLHASPIPPPYGH